MDLQEKVEEKNKDIANLKVVVVDLDWKIIDNNNKIIKRDREMT